jgi:hypothetical protein
MIIKRIIQLKITVKEDAPFIKTGRENYNNWPYQLLKA